MSSDLINLKECSNCGALIEARAKICEHCKTVFEIPVLTREEEDKTYKEVFEELNNAFFRFENFMYGNATTYESFDFDRAFTVFFVKTRETKNYTPKNFSLIDRYWSLANQIQYDLDKGNFDNNLALDNPEFEKDANLICEIHNKRLHEFCEFSLPDDITERRLSIVDIEAEFSEESSKDNKKKTSSDESDLEKINFQKYLNETSSEYISLYTKRLDHFKHTTEGVDIDFIKREIQFFEDCIYDLEHHEESTDGFSKLSIETFLKLDKAIKIIGYEKFYYSSKRKLDYLKSKLEKPRSVGSPESVKTINIDFYDTIGSADIENKPKSKKKKRSLKDLTVNEFFKKVRKCKIPQLEIYGKTQTLTDNFNLEKLKILKNDFELYLSITKDEYDSLFTDDDIKNAIAELQKRGRKIPMRKNFLSGEDYLDKEQLLYSFEFFPCYQFQAFLEMEIKRHKFSTRDYTQYNIRGPESKYDINYNELVGVLVKTFDHSKIDHILDNELYKLKKINKEGYEKDKGEFYNTYKSRANWIETSILIFDNEFIYTKKLAFKTAIKWCENWREKYLPLFDPYSPEDKERMHINLHKPLWKELDEYAISQIENDEQGVDLKVTDYVNQAGQTAEITTPNGFPEPVSFSEIFTTQDWHLYIDALHEIEFPILDKDYNFTGKIRGDKGVLCAWISDLQERGIIKKRYNRQQLAFVLNNCINDLSLGKDARTFDNPPQSYARRYKNLLFKHTKLLP